MATTSTYAIKNLQNITIATNANGNVTKDNISRVEKDRERNLPLYSVKTHKIYKGLHVNYLNGQEDRTCTTGMINPKNKDKHIHTEIMVRVEVEVITNNN